MHRSRRARMAVGTLTVAVAIAACGGDDGTGEPPATTVVDGSVDPAATATDDPTAIAPPGLVTPQQAADIAAVDAVTVVDVRTPAEFEAGHLADAVLVDLSSGEFEDRIAELDRDGDYLVYCQSDNRSGQAVAIMEDLGFERVWDLDGGIVAWTGAGLPVVT